MKKKNISIFKLFILMIFANLFFSCATLQKDIVMSTDSLIQSEDIEYLEKSFTQFDAKILLIGNVNNQSSLSIELERLESDILQTIKVSGVNKIILSRLYALDGLTCLLQGKKQKAKSLYNKSIQENKGDSYTIILGSRLGEINSLSDKNVISGSNETALLTLEEGLNHYIKGEYNDCVAKLDSAFITLPDFYRVSYNEIRQNAWSLRNNSKITDDKKILAVLNKNEILVGDMVLITQETTSLFYTINGGKKFSESDLFLRLNKAGYFDSCSSQKSEKNSIKRNQKVSRSLAARFLWNILCDKKSNESKIRNSILYRQKVGFSPIPDVDLYDSDFDAILGCVEREIMVLSDGVNFNPEKSVSASEFYSWVKQIK